MSPSWWPVALLQVLIVSLMHWGVLPHWMRGFWATREIISYQFYLIAGMVVASISTRCTAGCASMSGSSLASPWPVRGWPSCGTSSPSTTSSPGSVPAPIPSSRWSSRGTSAPSPASISSACGWSVAGAPPGTRSLTKTGSDDSYGIYLAQLVFITALGWFGWRHLNAAIPWPILSLITVVIVFLACIALTELLARTALAKPLTGRSRIARRVRQPHRDASDFAAQEPVVSSMRGGR